MSLSDKLISDFAKMINEKPKDIKTTHNLYGTVTRVTEDNTVYVKIDGSEIETPVSSSVTTLIGNRVSVMINGHSALITGNISDPSASKTTVDTIGSVATEAKTTAEGAETTATEAKTTAEGAETTATEAKTTAEGAATAAQSAFTKATQADATAAAASTTATNADTKAAEAFNKASSADAAATAASSAADAAKKVATNYIVQDNNGITLGNASGGSMVGGQVNLNASGMSIINGQGNEVANYSNTTRIGFQSGHNVKIDNDTVDICSEEQVDATFGSTTRIGVSDGHNVKIDNDSIDICSGTQVDATFGSTTRIGVQNGHNVKIGNTSIDICSGEQADATFGSDSIILRDKYGNEAVKLSVSGFVNELISQGRIINTTSIDVLPFPRAETITSSMNLSSGSYLVRNINTNRLTGVVTTHSYIIELTASYTSINKINYYGPLVSKVEIYNSSTPSTVYTVRYFDVDENCDSVLDIKGLVKVSCEDLNPNTHGDISNGLVVGKNGSNQTVITPSWIFSRSPDGGSYKPHDLYINPSGGRVLFGGLNTYIDEDNIQTDALNLGSVGKIDYTVNPNANSNLNIGIDNAKLTMASGTNSLIVGTNKDKVECVSPVDFIGTVNFGANPSFTNDIVFNKKCTFKVSSEFEKTLTIANTSVFKPSGATSSNILACYNSGSSFSASNTFWTSGSFRRTYDSSSATEKYTHYIDFVLPISKYITCDQASLSVQGTMTLRGLADSGSIAAASQTVPQPTDKDTGYNISSSCSISAGRNSLHVEIVLKGNTKFNLLPGMPISIQWSNYTINFT